MASPLSMKTSPLGASSELPSRTRSFQPTATNGRRWTAQFHSNANASSMSRCSGLKRNMFDSHFTLSVRMTQLLSDGTASAQLGVDRKVINRAIGSPTDEQ